MKTRKVVTQIIISVVENIGVEADTNDLTKSTDACLDEKGIDFIVEFLEDSNKQATFKTLITDL